ncbi:MAG: PaaI family thioesterase [Pseudomonadota bacterium]
MTEAPPEPRREAIPPGPPEREGFQDRLGLIFTHRAPDELWAELEVTPFHLNRSGIVHGGVYATILDAALNGAGCYCPHPGRVRRAVTLSLTTKYAAAHRRGVIRVHARKVASGRRIFTATGEATSESGELLAHAVGSFQYWRGSETEQGEDLAAVRAASRPQD